MNLPIITAAGGVVLNNNEEILMIFRRGKWDLPKGKLDPNETIEACAVREVMEETGVQNLQLGKFIAITNHQYFDRFQQQEVIKQTYWYFMTASQNEVLIPQTEEDITDIQWVSRTELSACMQNTYDTIFEVLKMAGIVE